MMKKSLAVLSAAFLLHGIAQASSADTDSAGTQAGTWAAQAQLGFLMTNANTSTKSGNASFAVAHKMGRWTLSAAAAALYASTGQYTTQQDTNAHVQADLELSPRTFWFSSARWDRNLFSGFVFQESVATGAGFKFVQSRATLLAGELGIGFRREQPESLTLGTIGNVILPRVRQPVVNDAVVQAGLNYSHSITHSTKLVNTLLVQYGSSDTTTTDNLSVQVKVDASLSLAVGMQLVNNTNPPAATVSSAPGAVSGVHHTDTVLTVNLVYALHNPKLSPTAGTPVTVNGFNLP